MLDQFLLVDRKVEQEFGILERSKVESELLGAEKNLINAINRCMHPQRLRGFFPRVLHLILHGKAGGLHFAGRWIDTNEIAKSPVRKSLLGLDKVVLWSCFAGIDRELIALFTDLCGVPVVSAKSWLGRKSGTENLRLDSYQLSDLLDLSKMPHEFSFAGEDIDFDSADDFDGTSDDDDIAGGDGDDDLSGGFGDDDLNGGDGDDTLIGGEGSDEFQLSSGDDVIQDFDTEEDVISVDESEPIELSEDDGDVLIAAGDGSITRVSDVSLDDVANSIVPIEEGSDDVYFSEDQSQDILRGLKRLLGDRDVKDNFITIGLSDGQRDFILNALKVRFNREGFFSGDILASLSRANERQLLEAIKTKLRGDEVDADQLSLSLSDAQKEALVSYVKSILLIPDPAGFTAADQPIQGPITDVNLTINVEEFNCSDGFIQYEVTADTSKDSVNIALELKTLVGQSESYYTRFLEFKPSDASSDWRPYKQGDLVSISNGAPLLVRVERKKLEEAGFQEPSTLTLRASEVIVDNPDIPIIDVNYRSLNIDGAVDMSGRNISPGEKQDLDSSSRQGIYHYNDLISIDGKTVGARVEWTASKGVDQLRFDDWSGNGARKRFQPIISTNNSQDNGGKIDFKWSFFYTNQSGLIDLAQPVQLGRFWMNPIDLDGSSSKWEFFDFPSELNSNELLLTQSTNLTTTVSGNNNVSPFNLKADWTRVSGAKKTCDGLCDDNPKKGDFSASVNFFEPKPTLEFSYGVHGKDYGNGSGSRLFSVSLGDSIIAPPPPNIVPAEATSNVLVEDCDDEVSIVVAAGDFDCLDPYLMYDIQVDSGDSSIDLLLELTGEEIGLGQQSAQDDYTRYLEVSALADQSIWDRYVPGTTIQSPTSGSILARVKVDELINAGLPLPSDVTLRASEVEVDNPQLPIIDVDYQQMNIDGAVFMNGASRSASNTISNAGGKTGRYYYNDLLEFDGKDVGAIVQWKASDGVDRFRFDDFKNNGGARERFQPVISSNGRKGGGTVEFTWNFYYVGSDGVVDESDQKVALGRFKMNPIDIDGNGNKWEFLDLNLEENVSELSLSAQTDLTPTNQNSTTPRNLQNGWTRVQGADYTCNGLCLNEELSASVNFLKPQHEISFVYGVHGNNYGDGSGSRLFSVSFGNDIAPPSPPDDPTVEDEATITVLPCPGNVESITASGVCITDNQARNATFKFEVEVSASHNQAQTYYYELDANRKVDGYEVKSIEIVYTDDGESQSVAVDDAGKAGTFVVPAGVGREYVLKADIRATNRLDGDEAITLRIDNEPLNNDSKSETATIDNFENCVVPGIVENVNASGVCITDDQARNATFKFEVELSAAYNQEQTYYYELDANRKVEGYEVKSIEIVYTDDGESQSVAVDGAGKSGTFVVPAGVGREYVLKADIRSKTRLDGEEAITLRIDNQPLTEASQEAKAKINNFENCVVPGVVENVNASGVCITDDQARNATFKFEVELSAAYNQEQTYYYELDANRKVEGYEVKAIEIVYTDDGESQSVAVDDAGKSGTFVVPAGVGREYVLKADIRSKTRLDGEEAITLRIDNQPLTEASQEAKATINNFENCVVPGVVENVNASGVCITDDQAKNATFKFEVELSAAYNQEQTYYYELDANRKVEGYEVKAIEIVYTDDGESQSVAVDGAGKSGTFVVPAGVGREYVLKADIRSKTRLDGEEAITLRIDNQPLTEASQEAKATINNFENCVVPGVVENVNASGVCITDDQAKNATFKFEVELSAAYNQEQTYYYELDANRKVEGYEVKAIEIVYTDDGESQSVAVDDAGKSGTFVVPAGVGREYVLKADIRSKTRLDGEEAITLRIDNQPLTEASQEAKATINNFENCVVPGVVENVNASGVCITDDQARNATFKFEVELSAAYNQEQTYYYELDANRKVEGYEVKAIEIVYTDDGESQSVAVDGAGKSGTFVVPAGVGREYVLKADIRSKTRLDGEEAITLRIDNQPLTEASQEAKATINNFENCVVPGVVENVNASGVCITDDQARNATFKFEVELSAAYNQEQTYYYELDANRKVEGYEVKAIEIVYTDDGESQSVAVDGAGKSGTFVVPAGVGREYVLKADIRSKTRLDGEEAITLRIDNQPLTEASQEAKATINNFENCVVPGVVENVNASGVCITDDQARNATFKFEVELSAAYNQEQTYYYELDANRKVEGYEVKAIEIVYTDDGESQSVAVDGAGKSGTFVVPAGVGREYVLKADIRSKTRLDGEEAITLRIDNQPLTEASQEAKATINNFENCVVPGVVENVNASGVCITDDQARNATFKFEVELSAAYNQEQTYYYELDANRKVEGYEVKAIEIVYTDDGESQSVAVDGAGKSGTFVVPAGVGREYVLKADIRSKTRLDGEEAITLRIDNQPLTEASQEAKATINNFENCVVPGVVENVNASGVCITDDQARNATFKFEVELSAAYNQEQTYYYELDANRKVEGYEVKAIEIVYTDDGESQSVAVDGAGKSGTFVVPAGVGREYVLKADIRSKTRLDGEEAITLRIDNQPLTEASQEAKATINNFENCVVPGVVENVNASGVCITDDQARNATFKFEVELSAAYNQEQTYYYELDANRKVEGYEVKAIEIVYTDDGESQSVAVDDAGKSGTFVVPAGVGREYVLKADIRSKTRLDGEEAITLRIDNQPLNSASESATAQIDNFENCVVPQPRIPTFLDLLASAACDYPESQSDQDALFSFDVSLDPVSASELLLDYEFDVVGFSQNNYTIDDIQLRSSDDVVLLDGAETGSIEVAPLVTDFSVDFFVSSAGQFTGSESVTLTMTQPDGTPVKATAAIADADDCQISKPDRCTDDVVLYLMLDNSTSMLLPDPSTAKASRKDRLEAQDRIALDAYQQALSRAGYSFRRIGDDEVLTDDEFRKDVANNSTETLMSVLDDFEVVVTPGRPADSVGDLVVHMITYGYAVDYDKLKITAGNSASGIDVARAILDVKTPDQVFGNSIQGNKLWDRLDLPDPVDIDLFQGDGRPSSNLYSGTEMYAAFKGLSGLLERQANSGKREASTYVAMTTDGRPERRAWWDTRVGVGSDSLTGVSVPLPQSLGGDPITTSGLIYDEQGSPQYLLANDGTLPWPRMQQQLNSSLDELSSAGECGNPVEVEVFALGDDTDADFPRIYLDLFGRQTFDPSNGRWGYDYEADFGFAEFSG